MRSVRALAEGLPPSAWQALHLRPGAKGPLVFAFARLRVWAVRHRKPGPACWLLLRRSLEPDAEVKYYVVNAPADEPLQTMALVSGTRYRVEEFLEEAKGYLGKVGAASGTVELVASILGLRQGVMPATLNYDEGDPECQVSVIAREPRRNGRPYAI